MVETFERTTLWSHLAYREHDPDEKEREWLRSAFLNMRSAVQPLAGEIARSMPDFTDHSAEHVDALWEMADLVIGEDYPLTPAEVFVLGCAFLMHDVGMGLVAYPGGLEEIKQESSFADSLVSIREANPALSEERAVQMALTQYLRRHHAKQASNLMSQEFHHAGTSFHLLQDPRLRQQFGHQIGKIAESHWYDVAELPTRLRRPFGAMYLPPAWTVDPVKLAAILRLADACHLDQRRAPLFLHAFRKPVGSSEDHWLFQSRMAKPIPRDDRLEYTSSVPFTIDESSAWWVAYDSLNMVDAELRGVDALCADLQLPRMRARSVAGVEDPARFARFVETANWTPIDASLRVSKVPDLIQRLGGRTLYGDEPMVALRELISNAADAVRARRVQFENTGLRVEVRLIHVGEDWHLTVVDNGLGMSASQMVRFLTDFGNSQWSSQERLEEFPGLASKGFKATGRYGIGFFSAFMVADKVRVRSLAVKAASSETHILEFHDGLRSRPLIRQAASDEELSQPGTEVSLVLRDAPLSADGLFQQMVSRLTVWELLEVVLCEMCFLLDVDLFVSDESGDLHKIVSGNEWKTLSPSELYHRLYLRPSQRNNWWERAMYAAFEPAFIANLEDIYDDEGDIVGRAVLAAGLDELVANDQWWWPSPRAHVYVGGMKTDYILNVLGVLVGVPKKADRSQAFPIAGPDKLKAWAASQAERCGAGEYATPTTRYEAGQLAMSLGVVAQDLPCAFARGGLLSPQELEDWIRPLQEVYLIPRYEVLVYHDDKQGTVVADSTKYRVLDLPPECLVVDQWTGWLYPDEVLKEPRDERFLPKHAVAPDDWDPAEYWYHRRGSVKLVLEAAASAWGLDIVELGLGTEALAHTEHEDSRLILACRDGGEVRIEAARISRRGGGRFGRT